jgi:hypothetical protein
MEALMAAARVLVEADAAVEEQERVLKVVREKARVLREETLPNAMLELDLTRIDLSSGETLKLSQDVYASIPKEGQDLAFAWLTKHKYDGIIKTEVGVAFGKGELKKAQALYMSLVKKGFDSSLDQHVHASTLKAFLKERMADGTDIPLELFGAWPVFTTKLTVKK